MVYRGRVTAGVVVLEGEPPLEGTLVEVIPVKEDAANRPSLASHPAAGIWKDRTDLAADSSEATRQLGRKLMGLADE